MSASRSCADGLPLRDSVKIKVAPCGMQRAGGDHLNLWSTYFMARGSVMGLPLTRRLLHLNHGPPLTDK